MTTPRVQSIVGLCAIASLALIACGMQESQPRPISFSLAASTRSANDTVGMPESNNSSSKVMAPNYSVKYVVDGTLANLGKDASSWHARTDATVSSADLKKIATALGAVSYTHLTLPTNREV